MSIVFEIYGPELDLDWIRKWNEKLINVNEIKSKMTFDRYVIDELYFYKEIKIVSYQIYQGKTNISLV